MFDGPATNDATLRMPRHLRDRRRRLPGQLRRLTRARRFQSFIIFDEAPPRAPGARHVHVPRLFSGQIVGRAHGVPGETGLARIFWNFGTFTRAACGGGRARGRRRQQRPAAIVHLPPPGHRARPGRARTPPALGECRWWLRRDGRVSVWRAGPTRERNRIVPRKRRDFGKRRPDRGKLSADALGLAVLVLRWGCHAPYAAWCLPRRGSDLSDCLDFTAPPRLLTPPTLAAPALAAPMPETCTPGSPGTILPPDAVLMGANERRYTRVGRALMEAMRRA